MSQKRVVVLSDHFKVYNGRDLERGQVFNLQDQLNDLKLFGWGYIRELEPKEDVYTCKCGREFFGSVTDAPAHGHNIKWRGQCSPLIDVDGVQVKSGARPILRGGGDPDRGDVGWDVGVGGESNDPPVDPYAGQRTATGKERPKRVALGG